MISCHGSRIGSRFKPEVGRVAFIILLDELNVHAKF